MKPDKILYVDDEAMALKYFERLVSPIAPVITALSVAEGKAILEQRGGEIAVLVSDQRMPGAHGNELLRYARDHHPLIVRMLTTAYSELGEAIEAINTGEIYRYITKPWEMDSLRADLRNALELADLRQERDSLLREKMLITQQQIMATRVSQMLLICAGFTRENCDESLYTYFEGATLAGCSTPAVDWHTMDHADLMQAEAFRGTQIGQRLLQWFAQFGADKSPTAARAALHKALPEHVVQEADAADIVIAHPQALYGALQGPSTEAPSEQAVVWLAWLVWFASPVKITKQDTSWILDLQAPAPTGKLPKNWLAGCIERLGERLLAG